MAQLMAYDWPGNVRELRNVLNYALVMSDGKQIDVADLPPELQTVSEHTSRGAAMPAQNLRQPLSEEAVMQALNDCNGNLTLAAKALGVGRTTLWRYRKLWQDKNKAG